METNNLQENDTKELDNITFTETKQIVDAYLKRSLSQNAKSSTKDFKPEGYHKLMRNGKLQTSLPTSSTSTLASSQLSHSAPAYKLKTAWQGKSLPDSQTKNQSLNDLKKRHEDCSGDFIGIVMRCSSCMESLKDDKTFLKCLEDGGDHQATDSVDAVPDNKGLSLARRASFVEAVSRKSVISFLETDKNGRFVDGLYVPKQLELLMDNVYSENQAESETTSNSYNMGTVRETKPTVTTISQLNNHKHAVENENESSVNHSNGLWKRVFRSKRFSNKKSRTSISQNHQIISDSEKVNGLQHTRFVGFGQIPSVKKSLNYEKAETLPTTSRHDVRMMRRRNSEDFNNQTHEKRSLKSTKLTSKKILRPQHLDISPKKRPSFLRRFMKGLRRPRHKSQSSTSSSVSLPSIPHACDDDDFADEVISEKDQKKGVGNKKKFMKLNRSPKKYYQHRGSMSFSSGDLEKYEYEQIAETLERISISFNRQIYSRSSTPCIRLPSMDCIQAQSGWDNSSVTNLSRSSSRMTQPLTPEPFTAQSSTVLRSVPGISQESILEVESSGPTSNDDQTVDRAETISDNSYPQSSSVDSPMTPTDIPSTSTGITNEDRITKLVDLLVERLITRGDHVENTVGLQTTLEPAIRQYATNYLSNVSYHNFHTIAGRVIRSVGHMINSSGMRHPEILPVVMSFNMLNVMYEITTSESAFQHVVDLSTRYVTSFVQSITSSWRSFAQNLNDELQQNCSASISPSFNHTPTEDSNERLDEEVD